MATISINSNDGALDSASAVLEVTATNPEYILYVEDGALKYRGSNGTVTVIAPA